MIPPAPWDILEVDVAEGLASVPRSLARPALLIFRYRGAVLGLAHLLPSELPMGSAEAAAFAARAIGWTTVHLAHLCAADVRRTADIAPQALAGLRAEGDLFDRLDFALSARRARSVRSSATIVVSMRPHATNPNACLTALAPEAVAGREIIVVGRAPHPDVEAAVGRRGARYLTVLTLTQARNAGLRAATGDVVLFTESDAQPEPGWADALLRRFDEPEVVLAGGLVLPSRLTNDAQLATYLDPNVTWPPTVPLAFDPAFLDGWRRGPPIWEIGAAANMAFRREAALRAGGFDATAGAPEADLWLRLLRAGGQARFEPLAVVRQTPPETWKEARRAAYERSRDQTAALLFAHGRHRAQGALVRALIAQPRKLLARLSQAPGRWLSGEPDRLLGDTLLGYAAGLSHVASAFRHPASDQARLEGLPNAERDA